MNKSFKQYAARWLTSPAVGQFVGWLFRQRIPHRGCVIDTSSFLVSPKMKARLFWRLYEHREVGAVCRHLPPNLDVVELGAGIGVVSCQILRKLQSGRLIAVEADPALVEIARRNINLNGFSKRAVVLNSAVGREAGGMADFIVTETNLSGHLGGEGTKIRVPVVTLGSLLQTQRVGDFALVSDIEGAETTFILENPETLSRCRFLIAELHGNRPFSIGISVSDMMAALSGVHGFRLVESHGQGECICCICARP